MRLLVCGSRTFTDYAAVSATLDDVVYASAERCDVVINGGMMGADALSSYWAYERKVDTICCGARWGAFGSSAGPQRNRFMLVEHMPTIVVAFYDKPREESRGTAHMVRIAREAGVPVVEIGPN